jgi:hypothetical protein
MTLIIKELVIRGVISKDASQSTEDLIDKKELVRFLGQMQKDLKKDCLAAVLSNLESKKTR